MEASKRLCIYRKRLTLHEIKRVADESTSESEDGQRDKRVESARKLLLKLAK